MWTNPLSKRPWVVHKFGGTSVANAECYRRVVDVLENENLLTSKLQGTGQGVVREIFNFFKTYFILFFLFFLFYVLNSMFILFFLSLQGCFNNDWNYRCST